MFYYDAHCHWQDAEVVRAAQRSGVRFFMCNATSPNDWARVRRAGSQNAGVFPCIGVHPWYVDDLPDDWELLLHAALMSDPALMIGEVGLDGTRPFAELQMSVFETCLRLGNFYRRPVHIHAVHAVSQVIDLLTCYPDTVCLLHRFAGDRSQIKKLLRFEQVYFSTISSRMLSFLPKERLLIESDAPDGLKRSERVISFVRENDLDLEQLSQNFLRFVGTSEPLAQRVKDLCQEVCRV